MKKFFVIVPVLLVAVALFASAKHMVASAKTTSAPVAASVVAFAAHTNYCLAANGDINSPSGPIPCFTDSHLDDVCVAAARTKYKNAVKAIYTSACGLARQYNKDCDTAVANCHGTQTCIDAAQASLEMALSNLDSAVNAAVTAATSTYWADAGACCVPGK